MSFAPVLSTVPLGTIGGFALSGMVQAIKALYHVVGEINEFIDDHIDKLKQSDNNLIASTGRVLEAAKYGFGLGYVSSVAIIAVGQFLMGNTLAAIGTVTSAMVLANPFAMTCAAVGAIYYGWHALTDLEREQILERLSSGLTLGIELIRSLVEFVIRKTKEKLTTSQLDEIKGFVKRQAALFGRSLYDVTHEIGDWVKGSVERAGEVLKDGADMAGDLVKGGVERTGEAIRDGAKKVGELTDHATKRISGGSKMSLVDESPSSAPTPLPSGSKDAPMPDPALPRKDQD